MLSLRPARDVKRLHFVTLRRASEAEVRRGAVRPSDHPVGVSENHEDVLAFGLQATSQAVRERCPRAMLRLGPSPIPADFRASDALNGGGHDGGSWLASTSPRDYPLIGDRLRNRRIRSSIGGWVLKRLTQDPPASGLTMNKCAVAGFAAMGRRCEA
jgi:hypothetical protein